VQTERRRDPDRIPLDRWRPEGISQEQEGLARDVLDAVHVWRGLPVGPEEVSRIRPHRRHGQIDAGEGPRSVACVEARKAEVFAEERSEVSKWRGWERWKDRVRRHRVPCREARGSYNDDGFVDGYGRVRFVFGAAAAEWARRVLEEAVRLMGQAGRARRRVRAQRSERSRAEWACLNR